MVEKREGVRGGIVVIFVLFVKVVGAGWGWVDKEICGCVCVFAGCGRAGLG